MPNLPKLDNKAIMYKAALDERDSLLAQVKRMDAIIAALHATPEVDPTIPQVTPNEYRGLRPVDALETYLRARRGSKIALSKAVEDLITGGVDPGRPRGRQTAAFALIAHTLKIGFPNKKEIFEWEPKGKSKNGHDAVPRNVPTEKVLIWLAETADIPRIRKRTPKKHVKSVVGR